MLLVYTLKTPINYWGRFSRFHESVIINHEQLYSCEHAFMHAKQFITLLISLTQVPSVRQWWIFGG